MNTKQHAIIIGAGFGGLATACMLGKAGYKVTVIEKNDKLGGRANLLEAEGYRFDMGPSWYLMPDIFDHFFDLMGEKASDYYALQKLDPSYRIFFKDTDRIVDVRPGKETNKEAFELIEAGSYERFLEYLDRSEYQYNIALKDFVYKNYSTVFDFFSLTMAVQGVKLSVFKKMDKYVKQFFHTPEMQKIMQYTLVFLGSSPYNTPALYNIMAHVDFNNGVYYPEGGIYSVVRAMEHMAKKYDVTFHLNVPVEQILVNESKEAVGVRLSSGVDIAADLVISNADYHFTETQLLAPQHQTYKEKFWKKKTLAPSAFLLYLGVDGEIPNLKHHTFLFNQDWDKGFAEVFDHPVWPNDPSIYVCNPSKTDDTVAPKGKENIFILVPIAAGLDTSGDILDRYEEKILQTLEEHLCIPNFRDRIEFKKRFCIDDFVSTYNSYRGTALGLAHTMMQTAAFRPDTVSKKVKNLYYVGGNTNPGIGMPMCLISAELVYKRLIGETSGRPIEKI